MRPRYSDQVRIAGWAILTMVAAPGCRQIFGIDDTEVATTTVDGPSPIIDAELPDSPPSPPDAPLTDCGLLYVAVAGADPGHTYRARPSGAPWGMAQNSCVADGAYLVIIDDAEEELAIRAFVPDDPSSPFFWVGVTDAMAEGTYVTSLGAAATYLPWAPGQPTGAAEDCVLLADLGGFSDWNCDGPQSYACECGSN